MLFDAGCDPSLTEAQSERLSSPRLQAFLKHPGVGVALVYAVGIALRVMYSLDVHRPEAFVESDMQLYQQVAQRLLENHGPAGPWDVAVPLGFPALLAFLFSHGATLAHAGYVQLVVGCLVPGAVGLLGAAAFGRRTGMLAVVFASLYFPFIEYGAFFLTEIHFMLWVTLAFAAFFGALNARRRAVSLGLAAAGGLALSLSISMKNVGLLAAIGFFAADGVARLLARAGSPSASWRARLRPWVLGGALAAAGAAPVMGTLSAICTRANEGHFCFSGNKPAADFLLGHYGRVGEINWAPPEGRHFGFGSPGTVLRHYDERKTVPWAITDNPANAAEAWRWIGKHPFQAAVLSLDHIYDIFFGSSMWPTFNYDQWPFADLFQVVFVVLLFVPTLLACVRVARDGVRAFLVSRLALVLAPIVALVITVAIATGEVRYRIPFDPFFMIVACALATGELRNRDADAGRSAG